MAENAAAGNLTLVIHTSMPNSREMCWEQGKPCVYMSKDNKFVIAEWRNGVVQKRNIKTGKIVRTWPDGRVEHFIKGDPQAYKEPVPPS